MALFVSLWAMRVLPLSNSNHPHDLILGHTGWRLRSEARIPADTRSKHCHIIGASGEGKTKLLEDLICQAARSGLGLGAITPHKDLIENVLKNLISDRTLNDPEIRSRILYLKPQRFREYVIPFNILNNPDEEKSNIADQVTEAFIRTWPKVLEEAPLFEQMMGACAQTLSASNLSLMQLQRLINDNDFREQCLSNLSEEDFPILEFWRGTFSKLGMRERTAYTSSTLNKYTKFAFNPITRLMLGQSANHLNFKHILDNRIILLIDLGDLPPITRRLIGSLIVTFLSLAMMRRETSDNWSLFVDEFKQFVNNDGSAESFTTFLSESRKANIGLYVAHQSTGQLPKSVWDGLKNAYHRVAFSIDIEDAERMAKIIGRVETKTIKQDAKTETQQDQLHTYPDQWQDVAENMRSQQERWGHVATRKTKGYPFRTRTIPPYTATPAQVEAVKIESMKRWGFPHHQAQQNSMQSAQVTEFI